MFFLFVCFFIVVIQSLSRVRLFVTWWTAAHQGFLSFTISRSLLKLMSTELVMQSNHHILYHPFLLLPSIFLRIRVLSNECQLFTLGGQSIGTSASVLPVNIQGWFSFRLTGLVSLLTKGLSRVFSNTTLQKHQFFAAQPSLWSKSHNPYMTTGKTIALTIKTLLAK